jgi:hypothetical protein
VLANTGNVSCDVSCAITDGSQRAKRASNISEDWNMVFNTDIEMNGGDIPSTSIIAKVALSLHPFGVDIEPSLVNTAWNMPV